MAVPDEQALRGLGWGAFLWAWTDDALWRFGGSPAATPTRTAEFAERPWSIALSPRGDRLAQRTNSVADVRQVGDDGVRSDLVLPRYFQEFRWSAGGRWLACSSSQQVDVWDTDLLLAPADELVAQVRDMTGYEVVGVEARRTVEGVALATARNALKAVAGGLSTATAEELEGRVNAFVDACFDPALSEATLQALADERQAALEGAASAWEQRLLTLVRAQQVGLVETQLQLLKKVAECYPKRPSGPRLRAVANAVLEAASDWPDALLKELVWLDRDLHASLGYAAPCRLERARPSSERSAPRPRTSTT